MRRFAILPLLVALVCCLKPAGIRYPALPTIYQGALQIINFDVGQGEAQLVLYNQKSMLIDCGVGSNALKTNRVIPRRLDALLGNRHLDYFVATHYHKDHLGGPGDQPNRRDPIGLWALIEREGVTFDNMLDRGFWSIGEHGATQKHYERGVKTWLQRGVVKNRRVVQVGDKIDMGEGLDIEVVAASGNGLLGRLQTLFPTFIAEAPPSENDYSVALKITFGDFEMFTGGDLSGRNIVRDHGGSRQTYNDIETRVAKKVGPLEVYRVDHHGSAHSSNPCFAQTLHPMVSVFSTGNNRFGHPDPEVYERLKAYGDVIITGGIDPSRKDLVASSEIVGDDVEILVAPGGKTFWVNGKEYRALADAEELARPLGGESLCPVGRDDEALVQPGGYEVEQPGEVSGD